MYERFKMNFLKNLFVSVSSFKVEAFILAVIVAVFFSWHFIAVNRAVERTRYETTVKIETVYKERIRVLKIESEKVEKGLRETIVAQQKETDEKLKVADTKYRNLLNSVRNRPERPSSGSGLSSNPGNGKGAKGATGKELYRNDSEFLIRLSRDAEELKTHLQGCYKQYDKVKEELDKFKQDNSSKTK